MHLKLNFQKSELFSIGWLKMRNGNAKCRADFYVFFYLFRIARDENTSQSYYFFWKSSWCATNFEMLFTKQFWLRCHFCIHKSNECSAHCYISILMKHLSWNCMIFHWIGCVYVVGFNLTPIINLLSINNALSFWHWNVLNFMRLICHATNIHKWNRNRTKLIFITIYCMLRCATEYSLNGLASDELSKETEYR